MTFAHWVELARHLEACGLRPGDPSTQSLEEARRQHEAYWGELSRSEVLDGLEQRIVCSDGAHSGPRVRCCLIRPPHPVSEVGILYLRGAGWWGGSLEGSRSVAHRLARESRLPVCIVDYRRSPEHAYPAQLVDVLTVMRWWRRHGATLGVRSDRLVLWGESAGASLAVCAAASAAPNVQEGVLGKADMPSLAGMVLLYGNHAGPHQQSARSRWIWDAYLGGAALESALRGIPLHQPVEGLPPSFIVAGAEDPLLHDSRSMFERLRSSDVDVEFRVYPGLPHSFAAMASVLAPAALAFSECALAARRYGQRRSDD